MRRLVENPGDFPRIPKNAFKALIFLVTMVAILGLFYPFQTVSETVKVIEVVDGDTLKVSQDGETRTVRLKGVDTPETSGYNSPEEFEGVPSQNWECLEDWGYNAKDFVKQHLEDEIILEYRKGVLTVERGSFGRLLADVRLDGNETLSYLLVEKGYARSYGDRFLELEEQARNYSRGLWGECTS